MVTIVLLAVGVMGGYILYRIFRIAFCYVVHYAIRGASELKTVYSQEIEIENIRKAELAAQYPPNFQLD